MKHVKIAAILPRLLRGSLGWLSLKRFFASSADDLLKILCLLGWNKKKSDDVLVLQMAIDNCVTAPASAANEYTKPTLSMHIIELF